MPLKRCDECEGKRECQDCDGEGVHREGTHKGEVCDDCKGTGECWKCSGRGVIAS